MYPKTGAMLSKTMLLILSFSQFFASGQFGPKIVLTNDDGWAVANVRAQFEALQEAHFNVILSSPAENKSGTGSSTATPTILNITCEFDTCPIGAPAEGFNAREPRLNHVNSFPVDAIRFGIQTLAPKFFRSRPDFVVSGFNVGDNLGPSVLVSGTVGAACEAAKEGIPSTAFSAATGSQISYTTLETDPDSQDSLAARTYAALTIKFLERLLFNVKPFLPPGITLNVNYPSTTNCTEASDFRFIFTKNNASAPGPDFETCGNKTLPDETSVVRGPGCFASVSVLNAVTKADVDAKTQEFVWFKLLGLFSCLPK